MNAHQLYKSDGSKTEIWYCGECGTVFGPRSSFKHETAEYMAGKCCVPETCDRCGCVLPDRKKGHCDTCRKVVEAEKLQATFEAAIKLKPADYDGFVYDPRGFYDGLYYASIEELKSNVDDLPDWVFACSDSEPRKVDADDVTELMFDDSFEDAAEQARATDELQKALDAFFEANRSFLTYWPDYTRVILLK